jgi:hypothetical protein
MANRYHVSPDSGNPLPPLYWQALRARVILNRRAFCLGADRAAMLGRMLADPFVSLACRVERVTRALRVRRWCTAPRRRKVRA